MSMEDLGEEIQNAFASDQAPDTLIHQAAQGIAAMQQIFERAAAGSTNLHVESVQGNLTDATYHLGQAAQSLAMALREKNRLLASWGISAGEAATDLPVVANAQPSRQGHPRTAVANTGSREVAVNSQEAVFQPDPRVLSPIGPIIERARDVNFYAFGKLQDTGIVELRDLYMAPDALHDARVMDYGAMDRIRRDMRESYPDLPSIPLKSADPEMAAFLYSGPDELPANLVQPRHFNMVFGHAVPKGTRITMTHYIETLEARAAQTGRPTDYSVVGALSHARDFMEKFKTARASGKRPRRADEEMRFF